VCAVNKGSSSCSGFEGIQGAFFNNVGANYLPCNFSLVQGSGKADKGHGGSVLTLGGRFVVTGPDASNCLAIGV
jgi:hypothetical protein